MLIHLIFLFLYYVFLSTYNPQVSVIIPVYNRGALLEKSVVSIQNQTYKNLQIIIVDDGSTDNTLETAYKLQKKDDRIQVLTQKHTGAYAARNLGIKTASGKYIAFQDSDDESHPTRIEYLLKYMRKHPQIDVITTAVAPLNETKPYNYVSQFKLDSELAKLIFYAGTPPGMHASMFIKKDFLTKNNILYDAKEALFEDVSIYRQIFEHNGNLINIPNVLYYYRLHADNPKQDYTIRNEFAWNYFNHLWTDIFNKKYRPTDYCERLKVIAKQNKKNKLFSRKTLGDAKQLFCPNGVDQHRKEEHIIRIHNEPEIILVHRYNKRFYSYKAKKYGTLIETNDTQTIVQWDNEEHNTIYDNFWSEK